MCQLEKKKIRLSQLHSLKKILKNNELNTVCSHARCPNINECYKKGTATFMILGDTCTRGCRFCNVKSGVPSFFNFNESKRILKAVDELGLKHVVITSVTRDDLPDGGAGEFSKIISLLKSRGLSVEVLTPDFMGKKDLLKIVLDSEPNVFNHNIETVRSLSSFIRPQASYDRSLEVLNFAKNYSKGSKTFIKTGFMLGLGESKEEVIDTIKELSFVDILTIGQYFRPNKSCIELKKYYTNTEFSYFENYAKSLDYRHVFSGTYVRSSYMAENLLKELENAR